MEESKKQVVKVNVLGITEALEKVNQLNDKLKEAKTLADELASMGIELSIAD